MTSSRSEIYLLNNDYRWGFLDSRTFGKGLIHALHNQEKKRVMRMNRQPRISQEAPEEMVGFE